MAAHTRFSNDSTELAFLLEDWLGKCEIGILRAETEMAYLQAKVDEASVAVAAQIAFMRENSMSLEGTSVALSLLKITDMRQRMTGIQTDAAAVYGIKKTVLEAKRLLNDCNLLRASQEVFRLLNQHADTRANLSSELKKLTERRAAIDNDITSIQTSSMPLDSLDLRAVGAAMGSSQAIDMIADDVLRSVTIKRASEPPTEGAADLPRSTRQKAGQTTPRPLGAHTG